MTRWKPMYVLSTDQPAPSTGIMLKPTRHIDAKTQHNCQMPNIKFRIDVFLSLSDICGAPCPLMPWALVYFAYGLINHWIYQYSWIS